MANRYWVGGTGNWNNTARWSESSGGAGGATVPGASDVAYVDAASLSATSTITINVAASVTSLIITGLDNLLNLTLSANLTCSTLFQCDWYTAINRTFIKSSANGTARTITAGTVTITNTDFQDITWAGAGSWDLSAITGGSWDCGGNTNITFTTADDWYWHEGTGNTSDYSKWYTATNGGGSQMASTRVPLPQDTLYFDSASFDSGSKTVTQNMLRIGSINFTGATNTPTFTTSTNFLMCGVTVTLISGMTLSGTAVWTFGRGANYINCWTKKILGQVILDATAAGSLTLTGNFLCQTLTIWAGTFNAVNGGDNYNVTCWDIRIEKAFTGDRAVNMGSWTWEVYSDAVSTPWKNNYDSGGGTTFNCGTSTLKITTVMTGNKTFTGGWYTYNNFWNNTTGNYILTINQSNTFAEFKIDAGRSMKFTDGTDQTCTSLNWVGTSANKITLRWTSTAGWRVSDTTGTNNCEWLDIDYSTAEGGATFNATNSIDGGHNTWWNITAPATATWDFFAIF